MPFQSAKRIVDEFVEDDESIVLAIVDTPSLQHQDDFKNSLSILKNLIGAKHHLLLVKKDLPNAYRQSLNVYPTFLGYVRGDVFEEPSHCIEGILEIEEKGKYV